MSGPAANPCLGQIRGCPPELLPECPMTSFDGGKKIMLIRPEVGKGLPSPRMASFQAFSVNAFW